MTEKLPIASAGNLPISRRLDASAEFSLHPIEPQHGAQGPVECIVHGDVAQLGVTIENAELERGTGQIDECLPHFLGFRALLGGEKGHRGLLDEEPMLVQGKRQDWQIVGAMDVGFPGLEEFGEIAADRRGDDGGAAFERQSGGTRSTRRPSWFPMTQFEL